MINKLWLMLLILGVTYALISGNIKDLNLILLESPTNAIMLILKLGGMLIFWNGMLEVAYASGLVKAISNKIKFITHWLFPELPKGHDVHGLIATNLVANIVGLGSLSTPIGIRAIKEMKKISGNGTATNSMITLLLINTSSLTVLPTTIITMRFVHGSVDPTSIIPLIVISSAVTTFFAILLDRIIRKSVNKKQKHLKGKMRYEV